MQACPYDALYIDPETHTAAKCNYCAHRVDVGLQPACVNVCPTQAIVSGDLSDPNSQISQLRSRQQVTARKAEKGTEPALFYIEGDVASLDPNATALSTESMWGNQSAGVGHFANHSEHALDQLGKLLSLGEKSETLDPNAIGKAQQVVNSLAPGTRRAYDAPQKGVLWGWQVTGYLWTKSISAGVILVMLLPQILRLVNVSRSIELVSLIFSLIFLGLTGGLLVWDLDQPKRFLNVLLRPQWRSWLVRGAYIITAFSALLMLYGVTVVMNWELAILPIVQMLLFAFAALTAIYTAFLFAQAKGRDFWQSPMLALHMLNHALIAGAATMAIWSLGSESEWGRFLAWFLMAVLVVNLLSTLAELTITHPSESAARVAHSITHGKYRNWFWAGTILCGSLLPLAVLMLAPMAWIPLAGALSLIGVFVAQHIWVRAPQQIPLS